MKRLALVFSLVFWLPAFASAQTSTETKEYRGRGQGYLFAGFGSDTCGSAALLHFGGGGEGVIYKGIGLGGEVGYLAPTKYLGDGIGILSANGLYQIESAGTRKLVPFLTGGYTMAFRSGTANGFNVGGGIHYWFAGRQGLRVEFRNHRLFQCNFWQMRLGLDLR